MFTHSIDLYKCILNENAIFNFLYPKHSGVGWNLVGSSVGHVQACPATTEYDWKTGASEVKFYKGLELYGISLRWQKKVSKS